MAYGTAGGTGAADEGVVLLEHNTLLQLLFWRRVRYRRKATDREEFSCEPPPTSPPHHTVLHVFVIRFFFDLFFFFYFYSVEPPRIAAWPEDEPQRGDYRRRQIYARGDERP